MLRLRVKTNAAPPFEVSVGPPAIAVLPSLDSATELPRPAWPAASEARSFACSVQPPPLRVKTNAAPGPELLPTLPSFGPPTTAVLPSADSATEAP